MKINIAVLFLFLSAWFSFPVFAADLTIKDNGQNVANNTQPNSKNDGEAIALLIVINNNEINAAKEASKRKSAPIVKKYAQTLNKDHTANLRQTLQLSRQEGQKPVTTEDIVLMKQKSKQDMSNLKSANDQNFQIVFIDAMVKGHGEALEKLNEKIKTVQNPALKQHLETTRAMVQHHLEEAQTIQQKLSANENNNSDSKANS